MSENIDNAIVFDSGVKAQNSRAVLPFRIVVEETDINGKHEMVIKRITYKTIGNKTYEEVQLLSGTTWRE